jgi:hypothetical protein
MFERNSFLLRNLRTLMLKIQEKCFPGCLKNFGQFWNFRLTRKIINVELLPINFGTLEKPDSRKRWAFWEFLFCPIISSTL